MSDDGTSRTMASGEFVLGDHVVLQDGRTGVIRMLSGFDSSAIARIRLDNVIRNGRTFSGGFINVPLRDLSLART